jgi:hypothetical protein
LLEVEELEWVTLEAAEAVEPVYQKILMLHLIMEQPLSLLVVEETVPLHQVDHLTELLLLEKKDLTQSHLESLQQVEEKVVTEQLVMVALEEALEVLEMKVDLVHLKELTEALILKLGE